MAAENARRLQTASPAARPRRTVSVRVEENQNRKTRGSRKPLTFQVAAVALTLVLLAAVLYTQSLVAQTQNQLEVQTQIEKEQLAAYEDLMFRLESQVDMRTLDEQARLIGLMPARESQKVYVITDRQNEAESVETFWDWLADIWVVVRGTLESWGL